MRRWTIKELDTFSDAEFLAGLCAERMTGLNCSGPLYIRLARVREKLNIEACKLENARRAGKLYPR